MVIPRTGFYTTLLLFLLAAGIVSAEGGDGRLVLFSHPYQELLEVAYRKGDGGNRITHLMRSPDGVEVPIAPELVRLIDQIQDHFQADTVEIISGYRSPEYNGKLKEEGRNVAKESLHTKGLAADIHLDEITEEAVYRYVRSLKKGGVGFYPGLHFVHIDLGPKRHWAQAPGPRKLVGTEANEGPCKVVTDKNFYLAGKDAVMKVKIAGSPECERGGPFFPEHFRRGQWQRRGQVLQCAKYAMACTLHIARLDPLGKYRLRFSTGKETPSLSNEFYLKRE